MLSAPATIPATSDPTFNPGFRAHPHMLFDEILQPHVLRQPHRRDQPGVRDTRFGASNVARVLAAVRNNRIPEVPFRVRVWKRRQLPSSRLPS